MKTTELITLIVVGICCTVLATVTLANVTIFRLPKEDQKLPTKDTARIIGPNAYFIIPSWCEMVNITGNVKTFKYVVIFLLVVVSIAAVAFWWKVKISPDT